MSRWKVCYNIVAARTVGDGIPYEEIEEALECNRQTAQSTMWLAKKYLERDGKRTVTTKTGWGWVVMSAPENISEADNRLKKIKRGFNRTARILNGTPRDELCQADKSALDFRKAQVLHGAALYDRKHKDFAELEARSREEAKMPQRRRFG